MSPAQHGNAAPAAKAQNAAIKRLKEMHAADYRRILMEERERLNLPKDPELEKVEAQLAKLEEKKNALQHRLNSLSAQDASREVH